jgi:hypothetical protein
VFAVAYRERPEGDVTRQKYARTRNDPDGLGPRPASGRLS